MNKKLLIALALASLLILSAGVVAAQNNRQQDCDQQSQDCIYQHTDSSTSNQQWNQRSRGRGQAGHSQMNSSNATNGMNNGDCLNTLAAATVDVLPEDIVDLMVAGWLDEQHAYAVYQSIMDQFGELNPFVNIQQAEVKHAAAWEFLFDRYGIEIPEVPEFEIPSFDTVSDACLAAVYAEVYNFELYDQMLATFETYPDLYQVALNLRNASEFNHLPAFENCAG